MVSVLALFFLMLHISKWWLLSSWERHSWVVELAIDCEKIYISKKQRKSWQLNWFLRSYSVLNYLCNHMVSRAERFGSPGVLSPLVFRRHQSLLSQPSKNDIVSCVKLFSRSIVYPALPLGFSSSESCQALYFREQSLCVFSCAWHP